MRQDSARTRQESVKVLAETAKGLINFFTYTSARSLVECGGLRVCELNPPYSAGSGGVCRLVSKIIAKKSFLSRNLAFLLAARWPPTLATDWCHRLLFCLFFFDRFLEGIFSIFVHFWASLGTPKIIKNRQKSTSEVFLFPSLCLSCFFSCFWLILDDFEDAKCVYFIGRADKICILSKSELRQSQDRF